MPNKKLITIIFLCVCCYSCAVNTKPLEPQDDSFSLLPDREETVGFFSHLHTMIRDTERATYDLMYGVRDGIDSFIYDAEKDYYENYQK